MKTTLYRYFDNEQNLLYLGITGDNTKRQSQHRRDSFWFGEIATASFEHFDSRDDALAAEKAAIKAEKPLHNKQHTNSTNADFDMTEALSKHHLLTLLNGFDLHKSTVVADESHEAFVNLARTWDLGANENGWNYDESLSWELFVVQIETDLGRVDFDCYKTCHQCINLLQTDWYLNNLDSAKSKLQIKWKETTNATR